jgi:hypothetical protein
MSAGKTRCWQYLKDGCRAQGTNAVRYGSHVYMYCDDPKHVPPAPKKRRAPRASTRKATR